MSPDAVPSELATALRRTALRREGFGEPLYYFTETTSTNDEASRLAEAGAPHGTTVVASAQTAGRGRLGRTWFSPPNAGLYASIVIREARGAPLLTLASGVAIAEGIRSATGLPAEIKWPNDVVIDVGLGKRRKLAGILTEASTSAEGLQFAVVGFGINLLPAAYPVEIAERATSIMAELGKLVDPALLLVDCLAALAKRTSECAAGEHRSVLDRWLELSPSARGARVECEGVRERVIGTTSGIAEDGALLVQTSRGVEPVRSGQVRWL